jgi:hypothetical protein
MKNLVVYSLLSLLALPALAGPMSRVVAIVDSHTLVVENGSARTTVQLTGVALPPDAETHAIEFLNAEVLNRWVLVETSANGTFVYRSPDALSINRAVAATWTDGPSQHIATILGTSAPGGRVAAPAKPSGPLLPLEKYAPTTPPKRVSQPRAPRRRGAR